MRHAELVSASISENLWHNTDSEMYFDKLSVKIKNDFDGYAKPSLIQISFFNFFNFRKM